MPNNAVTEILVQRNARRVANVTELKHKRRKALQCPNGGESLVIRFGIVQGSMEAWEFASSNEASEALIESGYQRLTDGRWKAKPVQEEV